MRDRVGTDHPTVALVLRALARSRSGVGVTLRDLVLASALARQLEEGGPRVRELATRLGLDLDDFAGAPVQLGLGFPIASEAVGLNSQIPAEIPHTDLFEVAAVSRTVPTRGDVGPLSSNQGSVP